MDAHQMTERSDAPLSEAISEMENAVQDTEASGRPAAHLYGAWQNLKHAILGATPNRHAELVALLRARAREIVHTDRYKGGTATLLTQAADALSGDEQRNGE